MKSCSIIKANFLRCNSSTNLFKADRQLYRILNNKNNHKYQLSTMPTNQKGKPKRKQLQQKAVKTMESETQRSLLLPLLILISVFSISEGCSSRAIPKPRPTMPEITTSRPNITFPTFNCPPTYAAWYCLNEATCFTIEIHNEILYNCECANGFVGQRCEYKEIDGSYLPTRQRAMLETASIASGATLALLFMLILCLTLYIRYDKRAKMKLDESAMASHENDGMDEVDGMTKVPVMRPFGPHHYQVLPLAAAFKR